MATLAEHMNRTETQCFTKRLQCLTTKDNSSREDLSLGLVYFSCQSRDWTTHDFQFPFSIFSPFISSTLARNNSRLQPINTQRRERELLRLTRHSIPMRVEHCHDLSEIPFIETEKRFQNNASKQILTSR